MFNLLIKPFIILVLISLEKKLSIDLICVSPIPSKSAKLTKKNFLFFRSKSFVNSFIELKKPAKIFAFSCPICLIPIEKINLSNVIV